MSEEQIQITRTNSNTNSAKVDNKSIYPTENIELPSKGYFYEDGNPLQNGFVEIKMMTAREEDILTNQNLIKNGTVLDKLLESLIVGPKNVNYRNLLISDKNALYIAARRLAYGDSYGPLEVQCPSCSEKNRVTFDLSTLENKEYDFSNLEKGANLFEFTLPFAKRNIQFKILNSFEEEQIENDIKVLSKKVKNIKTGQITSRLKRIIVSIDGDTDKGKINEFVDNELVSRDSMALRKTLKDKTPEIDLTTDFECESCGHEERLDVPMTVQFFWPES
jgi:hypothetical protein